MQWGYSLKKFFQESDIFFEITTFQSAGFNGGFY